MITIDLADYAADTLAAIGSALCATAEPCPLLAAIEAELRARGIEPDSVIVYAE